MPAPAQLPQHAPESIALCLSGGGFRASLFALGVARYLAEADLLTRVRVISAVSGGSVTAALLADRFPRLRAGDGGRSFQQVVWEPMVQAITSCNLRNRGIGRFALTRAWRLGTSTHGSALGETMVRHLLDVRRVAELPRDVQVLLTSCDLVTGLAFRVSQEFIGGYHFGYVPTPQRLRLADALAASTAVPMAFPPVQLATEGLGLKQAPHHLSLLDGGVYDNLGLEWFQGWGSGRPDAARQADFLLTVDASGPLDRREERFRWAASVRRAQAIQYEQSKATRLRWLVDELVAGNRQGLLVPIKYDAASFRPPPGFTVPSDAADGALPDGLAGPLSRLRTDLDRFSSLEAELLAYHAYWHVHVRMRTLHPHLAVARPSWRQFAGLDAHQTELIKAELVAGARRRVR